MKFRFCASSQTDRRRQRGYVNADGFWIFVILAAAAGAALAYGIPWLWSLIKPLIHAATA